APGGADRGEPGARRPHRPPGTRSPHPPISPGRVPGGGGGTAVTERPTASSPLQMTRVESRAERAFQEAALPAAGAPWREIDFTVIDLETTGLDPGTDEIISFATVSVSGGRITLADARYELVRPERAPDADTIRIHGLREADR